jgi:Ca-activated chloride channel family protein
MIWRFESPLALLLLLTIPVAALLMRRSRRSAVRFSAASLTHGMPRTIRQRVLWVPNLLRCAAIVLLIIAVARPQAGIGEVRTTADGVAMMIVLDRSWSMSETIEMPRQGGQPLKRIDVVRQVLRSFLEGDDKQLDGRTKDLIGLVTFGRYAETVCPLVHQHSGLIDLADRVELANPNGPGAGTAIGEGLALAAARLKKAEEDLAARNEDDDDPEFEIKSKVIVLLTDGDENITEIPAMQAAGFCAEWGIKVYAIGIGGGGGRTVNTPRGRVRRGPRYPFDEHTLRAIAKRTGGEMFAAEDSQTLLKVYERIDELEKTEIESTEFTRYRELFAGFAGSGGALLVFEMFLTLTLLRRSP